MSATIVDYLEEAAVATGGQRLPLSDPTRTWLDRWWAALVARRDGSITKSEFELLDGLFGDYLGTLDGYERRYERRAALMFLDSLFSVADRIGADRFIEHWRTFKRHEPFRPQRQRRTR